MNYLNDVVLNVLMKVSYEEERLIKLQLILNEMGFQVNGNLEVEISTHHGLILVDIIHNQVAFQPSECISCSDYGCREKVRYLKQSLCVMATNNGWSNLALTHSELEVLAKIFVFAFEPIPDQILKQIRSHCPRGSPPMDGEPYVIPNYPHFNQEGAKVLLQRLHIQFYEGRMPYYLYSILKARYEKFLE